MKNIFDWLRKKFQNRYTVNMNLGEAIINATYYGRYINNFLLYHNMDMHYDSIQFYDDFAHILWKDGTWMEVSYVLLHKYTSQPAQPEIVTELIDHVDSLIDERDMYADMLGVLENQLKYVNPLMTIKEFQSWRETRA